MFSWKKQFDFSIFQQPQNLREHSLIEFFVQAHVQKVSIQIQLKLPDYEMDIGIVDGKLSALVGVPKLFDEIGILMLPGMTLETALGKAMAKGTSFQDVVQVAETNFIRLILQLEKEYRMGVMTEGLIVSHDKVLGMSVPFPKTFPQMFVSTIQKQQTDEELLQRYSSVMRRKIQKNIPGIPITMFALPMEALRMFRGMEEQQRLSSLVPNPAMVTLEWRYIDILNLLGLIEIAEGQKELKHQKVVVEKKLSGEDAENKKKYQQLKKKMREMKELEYHVLFELKERKDVTDNKIDKKFRSLSLEYHPDRFVGEDSQIKSVVEEMYTYINEVHSALADEEYREKLKERLLAESQGLQYVSEEDAQKSDVLYAQAKFLFNKRRWEDAHEIIEKSYALDPYNWRVQFLRIRLEVQLGKKQKNMAAEELLAFTDIRGHQRIEVHFQAAEYLFASGEKERTYKICKNILEIDDEHLGAKRYLQRKERESKKEEQPKNKGKNKGFLGRFFGKK